MTATHSQFVGSIPEIYDAHLGPLFFEFSAADLAARVARAVPEGGRVLEAAAAQDPAAGDRLHRAKATKQMTG